MTPGDRVSTTSKRTTRQSALAAQHLAAIVEFSYDAIVSKDLNGVIQSWNGGAERLFGYQGKEVIGQTITVIIPEDRRSEETMILNRIRRGEPVEPYETIRRRKDGSMLPIFLTVSPIRSLEGEITGASKIARDISRQKRAEEQQRLLVRELHHQVKNLFSLASSLVSLSARSARTPAELASAVSERLHALERAQALTLPWLDEAGQPDHATTLADLVHAILLPYETTSEPNQNRVTVECPKVGIEGAAVTGLALVLHEFATNASKYGALSNDTGRLTIQGMEEGDRVLLIWMERGGPRIETPPERHGFGTDLVRIAAEYRLDGELSYEWNPEGLTIWLSVARNMLGG